MVPLNYSSGRLFCKFSILLLSIFLLFWIFLDKQQLSIKTEDLEVQLRFANEHISSLSAQINVISKHKDRIETLFVKEKERCIESTNQQSKRINLLQAENVRLNDLLMENFNQQRLLEKQISSLNESSLPKNDSPIAENKNNIQSEQHLEDPFDNKKDGNIPNIAAQIKAPNVNNMEENKDERKDPPRLTKENRNEPNGGEKHFEEDYNIFRRKNKPFEDLVFKRAEENEEIRNKKLKRRKLNKEEDENKQISVEEKEVVEEEKEEKEEEYVGKE
ncbi:hypothetical protein ACQ4LE_004654 [Meloidogyne hapla]|uniref:Uncharacterized protein n=1 Tax=Meloidogyne hapla TaxID=6305 RepID=A0A1I8BHZ7_MELHA